MKQFDPMILVAVFQEMLGPLFWPLVASIAAGALALLFVLLRDRRLATGRLLLSQGVGLASGFVAIGFMLWLTSSSLSDLAGGPVDWLLTLAIWLVGAIGGAIAAYVGLSLMAGRRAA